MTDLTNPRPGWYADPKDEQQLRLWDGSSWTDQVRPRAGALPPADAQLPVQAVSPGHAGASGPRRGDRTRTALVAGAAALALLAVGVGVWAITSSGGSGKAATGVTTRSPQVPAPGTDCTLASYRPAASEVLWWFGQRHLPATVNSKVLPPLPAGACTLLAFTDTRVKGAINFITQYSTTAGASQGATPLGPLGFANYLYVIQLDARLLPYKADYQDALARYVPTINPDMSHPPTTAAHR